MFAVGGMKINGSQFCSTGQGRRENDVALEFGPCGLCVEFSQMRCLWI